MASGDFLGIRDTSRTYTCVQHELAPFSQGVFFHLVYVFTPSEDGRWLVRGYKRNPLTGAVGHASFFAPAAWSPTSLVGTDCWLGRSLNGDMEDSVGGQTAQNVNGQYVALGGGQAVKLPEDGSGRIDLGPNAMPIGDAGATIELWARNDVHEDWARMFDFGSDGSHSFMVCWADYAGSKNDKD